MINYKIIAIPQNGYRFDMSETGTAKLDLFFPTISNKMSVYRKTYFSNIATYIILFYILRKI